MRKVRLKIAWRQWPKGHVFTAMPAAQAQVMVEAGRAEYVAEEVAAAPVDRMMRPAPGSGYATREMRGRRKPR